jgi:hypothetical protein
VEGHGRLWGEGPGVESCSVCSESSHKCKDEGEIEFATSVNGWW